MQGELSRILDAPAYTVAPRLLGSELVREVGGKTLRVRIVETEAYDQTDEASHSFHGITPRTAVMFGPAGFLYVYFTYGMHYCMNVVAGSPGYGAAALIRAVEPLEGIETMAVNRGLIIGAQNSHLDAVQGSKEERASRTNSTVSERQTPADATMRQKSSGQSALPVDMRVVRNLCNGPAKTCQALQIQRDFNGHDLAESPLKLILQPALSADEIVRSPRVGISRAVDKLWRFSVANNKFVSRPNRT